MNWLFNPVMSLKEKLASGQHCLGLFHVSANSLVSEALAGTSLDWVVYDMEASPADKMGLVHYLQSMKGGHAVAFVRTQSDASEHIEQVLDAGACGIIIPKVETKQQCQKIMDAMRYPPRGKRGVNPIRASSYFTGIKQYFSSANDEVLAIVQIESELAVKNVDEILSIQEIDGVFIGCGDLSMSLGCPGQMDSEYLLSAIDTVLHACRKHKKIPGIFAYNAELAERFIKAGFKFIAFGNDIAMLQNAVNDGYKNLSQFKEKI